MSDDVSPIVKWARASKRQAAVYAEVANAPGARYVVQAASRAVSGRTPDIWITCGTHRSGYGVALRLTQGSIEMDIREDDRVDTSTARILELGHIEHSGSLEWECVVCGMKWNVELPRLLYKAIQAVIDTPDSSVQRYLIHMP